MQNSLTIANYWNSPFSRDLFLTNNIYLPWLNQEIVINETFIENIKKLEIWVQVAAPEDDIIRPWDSAHFNFWKGTKDKEVEKMIDREVYKKDKLGLRTLNE